MKKRNREVFIKLIEVLKRYNGNFKTSIYLSIKNEVEHYHKHISDCGTSACIAGLIPLADKDFASDFIDEKGGYDFCKMSNALVMNNKNDWSYIYSLHWGNNVREAIERIETYLKTGSAPEEFLFYNE